MAQIHASDVAVPLQETPEQLTGRVWGGVVVLTLLVAAWVALSGSGSTMPLDHHEVFVAQSAREMIRDGALLVPRINGEVRINKPPLNYWLVWASDLVLGGGGFVSERAARLPSAAAGVALVGVILALGCVLFDRVTALVGAWLCMASSGYVVYTHNARPEMVYAALSAAGFLGLVHSEILSRSPEGFGPARRMAWAGWLMFALATMAKGPQLPALIVLGMVVYLWSTKQRGRILRVVRPITGIGIVLAVTAWWYIAVWYVVPNAEQLWHDETLTRLASSKNALVRYLTPYYLLRPMTLLLPWAVFYVLFWLAPWWGRLRGRRSVWMLWVTVITTMLVLSLSYGRRHYYVLPVLAPMALAMAAVGLEATYELWQKRGGRLVVIALAGLHSLGLGAALVGLQWISDAPRRPGWIAVAVLGGLTVVWGWLLVGRVRTMDAWRGPWAACVGTLMTGAVFFGLAAGNGAIWGPNRYERREFDRQVAAVVPASTTLVAWGRDWSVEYYYLDYLGRPIVHRTKVDELMAQLPVGGSLWLIKEAGDTIAWPADVQRQTIVRSPLTDEGDLELLQVRR